MMLKYSIQTSTFRYSKNYGSLTHETRIKDSVNMEDLICLLATVRTLKDKFISIALFSCKVTGIMEVFGKAHCLPLSGGPVQDARTYLKDDFNSTVTHKE